MNELELSILDALTEAISHPILDTVMISLSWLGGSGRIWIAIAVLLLCFRTYRKAGITLSTALIVDLVMINGILKPLFGRVRPFVLNPEISLLVAAPPDGGFPSGHTAASFAAATVLYHFNKTWGVAAYILALLIGFSRLYLYVHFPSDIIAGAVAGILIGVLAVWLVKTIEAKWADALVGIQAGAQEDVQTDADAE
jgi:undecaprenyl-diphosphatase